MSLTKIQLELKIRWRVYNQTIVTYEISGELAVDDVENFVKLYQETTTLRKTSFDIEFKFIANGEAWDSLFCSLDEVGWYKRIIPELIDEKKSSANFMVEYPEMFLEWDDDDLLLTFIERKENRSQIVSRWEFISEFYKILLQLDQWSEAICNTIEKTYLTKIQLREIYRIRNGDVVYKHWQAYLSEANEDYRKILNLWTNANGYIPDAERTKHLRLMRKFLNLDDDSSNGKK